MTDCYYHCHCGCCYTAAKRKEVIFVSMSSNVVVPKKCVDLQNLSFQRSKCGLWVVQAGLCADFSGLSICSEKYIRSSYFHGQSVGSFGEFDMVEGSCLPCFPVGVSKKASFSTTPVHCPLEKREQRDGPSD